jgi:hypothetical protein
MMAWQPSDWIALAGVIVSPLGAIAVAFLAGRQRENDRTVVEREKARAESAAVLGPLLVLLNDAEPYRLAVQTGPHTPEVFKDLRRRWMELRDSLGVMGAVEPRWSQEALRLVIAVDNALYSAQLWTGDVTSERFKSAAEGDHREAMQRAKALVNLVWRIAGGEGEMEFPSAPSDVEQDASGAP